MKITCFGVLTLLLAANASDSSFYPNEEFEESVKYILSHYDPDKIPPELRELAPLAKKYFMGNYVKLTNRQNAVLCSFCSIGADFILTAVESAGFNTVAQTLKGTVCPAFQSLNVVPAHVCSEAVNVYSPELRVMAEEGKLSGYKTCRLLLGNTCGNDSAITNWDVDFSGIPEKPVLAPSPEVPEDLKKESKILHITDIHLDLNYTVGSLALCKEPLCCREYLGYPSDSKMAAGFWGDSMCDIPLWTFKHMLEEIKTQNPNGFEYIFLTGDYAPHNIWSQTREENMLHAKTVLEMVKEIFPGNKVFNIIGNHESFPVNSFPPPNIPHQEFNPSWLMSGLAEFMSDWISSSAIHSFKTGGYYTEEITPDLRVIVINSNVCSNLNFWLNWEYKDLGGQLAWLLNELKDAESKGAKVHLLSHVPPGLHECIGAWGREFTRIVNRFENTISAQFYGHTHNDEFIVFYDSEETNSRATNVGFVTPSVTSYTYLNPSYRIFTVDGPYKGASMRVTDYDTYLADLQTANENAPLSRPNYVKLYNAKRDLEMNSLSPEEFDRLAFRLSEDDDFYERYARFAFSNGSRYMEKEEVLCRLVTTSSLDLRKCEEVSARIRLQQ